VEILKGTIPFEGRRCRWEVNIEVGLEQEAWNGME
jgi:hypothetical protein